MTSRPTKAALAAEASAIGVPSNRLRGTKPQLQSELNNYAAALEEAAADTAAAVYSPSELSDGYKTTQPKRIDPGHATAAAVLLTAGAKAMGWL